MAAAAIFAPARTVSSGGKTTPLDMPGGGLGERRTQTT
jgi:hypothetical protein